MKTLRLITRLSNSLLGKSKAYNDAFGGSKAKTIKTFSKHDRCKSNPMLPTDWCKPQPVVRAKKVQAAF